MTGKSPLLCDPIWLVISLSAEVISQITIPIYFTYLHEFGGFVVIGMGLQCMHYLLCLLTYTH